MTSNDRNVPTQEKALSVALSAIMVLSVIAIGMAGFAGSAAAIDGNEIANDGHSINANPANSSAENVSHTVAVGITSSSAGTLTNSTNITFGYGSASNVALITDGFLTSNNVSIEHIDENGHNVTLFSSKSADGNVSAINGNLEVRLDFNNNESSVALEEGDIIRANISNAIEHNGVQTGESVNVNVQDPDVGIDVDPELRVGSAAPIQLNGGDDGNFTSLHNATRAAEDTDDITLTGDVNEFLSNPGNVTTSNDGLRTASITNTKIDIIGNGNNATFDSNTKTYITTDGSNFLNISDVTLNAGDTLGVASNTAVDTAATDNVDIDAVTFDGFDTTALDLGDTSDSDVSDAVFNGSDFTAIDVDNVNGNGIDITNVDADGIQSQEGIIVKDIVNGASANISGSVEITSGVGIEFDDLSGGANQNVAVTGLSIESDTQGAGTGVQANSSNSGIGINISGNTINNVSTGIITTGGLAADNLSVSGFTFTNIGTAAVQITAGGTIITDGEANVNGITVEDSLSGNGVSFGTNEVNLTVTDSQFTDVQNGTSVNGNPDQNVTITDNTVTNATNGLAFQQDTAGLNVTANFNTIEDSDTGVIFNDVSSAGTTNNISLRFNDIVNSSANGLEIQEGDEPVNATYVFWGDSTGPNGIDQTSRRGLEAFGSGDNVTVNSGDNANVFPFLQESVTEFSESERAGEIGVIIEAPAFPQAGGVRGGSGVADTNTTVTVLNESAGVSVSDINGVNSQANIVNDNFQASGTLSPNNVATFNLSASQKGSFQTEVFISGINNPTEDQKFTGRLDSTSVTVNDSTIAAGEDVSVSVQAIDAGGQDTERQNLSVTFSNSGFPDADLQFTDQEAATDNTGEATALIRSGGSINPGETVDISARVGGTSFQTVSVTTAAGAPDAENSTLTVGGNANDKTEQVNSTLSVSARINDTDANNLEGQTVEFSSNESVSFEATNASVDTNANGFANTTVTLPNSTDIGTVAINATVGNFNPGNTGSASVNVTTEAAAPTQLGFATDSRSLAPSATRDVTVQVEDEFGNQNTSAGVNSGIAVSSSDTSVLSVSGVNDLGGNNNATFTLTGESAGEATINVTSDDSNIGAVEDTFTVAGADAIELSVAHNVATESASNANANTRNQALLTAQFVDSSGEALGISNRNVSFALSGQAAELNQSDNTVKTTDSDGNVTILVNGTDTTGTSDVIATDANVSGVTRGEATVTTTGGATTIDVAPANDTITQGESINVTTEFIDNEGRNVPRIASVSLSASGGTVPTGSTTTAPNADGAVVSTFSYNSSGANGSVTLTASGDGLFGDTTITVETVEPDAVQIDNVNLDPNSVTTNTTNDHDLTFDALNVSADNSTDSFAVEIPSAATLESANDVTVTTENVSAQNLAVDGNNITFDVNPDSESTTIDLSVEANVTVSVPNVSQETTADLTIDATDSDGTSDSASATLTITVEDGQPGDDGEQPTAEIEFGDDRTVPNRTSTVEVESATFNGSRDFVIVVHQTSPGANDVIDNTSEIGGKIGSSDVLTSNTVNNEPVNLNKTLDNNVTELTQNQTLVAMLHFANESRPGDRNFDTPITRGGSPVFDQTNVTVSPLEGAPGEADDDGNGEIETNELIDTAQQFGTGEFSVDELLEVIDAFTS